MAKDLSAATQSLLEAKQSKGGLTKLPIENADLNHTYVKVYQRV